MNAHQVYRADLQILRGVSVLLVFLYHLKIPGFQNGLLGVDIFFVLSGFLMATLANKVSPFEFYARRLKRLLPAYFVTAIVTSIAVALVTSPVEANQHLDRILFSLVGLSNFAFWAENSYFDSSAFKPLLNFWSLAVELQFYLLAPFLLPFLHKRKFLLGLVILISLLLSMLLVTVSPKTSFFMLPTRLWEFLLGACVAWFPVTRHINKIENIILYVAVVLLLAVLFAYPLPQDSLSMFTGHPSLAALIVVLSSTAIIWLGLGRIVSTEAPLSRVFIKLGDYSYSIYLVHFPIIVLVNYSEFGGTRLGYNDISHLLVIIFLTIVASFFLYKYVEKLRYSAYSTATTVALLATYLALAVYGGSLNKLGYSENEVLVFNAWEDRAVYRCGKLNRIFNPFSDTCLLGDELNGDKVLLLGNSHADSIKMSFQEPMKDNGITTFFYVANNPLMSSSQNASRIFNEVVEKRINTVVIHYSASFYNNDANQIELTSFVDLMDENNISVHFIAPVPGYDHHIPKAMIELIREPSSHLTSVNYESYQLTAQIFYNFISENTISSERVFYPHEIFCSGSECEYQSDGVPYYYDTGHLTLTGAERLQPLFNGVALKIISSR